MLRLAPVILTTALCLSAAAQSPVDTLKTAASRANLTEIEQTWHTKVELTVYDAKGENPIPGTFEYAQAGKEVLYTYTIGDASRTFLRHEGKRYEKTTNSTLLDIGEDIYSYFLHPGPGVGDTIPNDSTQRKQKFGKSIFQCIMLGPEYLAREQTPLGLFPTYCLEPDNGTLRLAYSLGGKQFTILRTGKFLEHIAPVEFTLSENGIIIAKGKVLSMGTFTPSETYFVPTDDLTTTVPTDTTARMSSGVVAGLKIAGDPPVYPASARSNHQQGTVTLHAIIGRDGRVRSLRVITAPTIDLAESALIAVRTWRYRPYLLNGVPTSIDTTVIMNFNLNGG